MYNLASLTKAINSLCMSTLKSRVHINKTKFVNSDERGKSVRNLNNYLNSF